MVEWMKFGNEARPASDWCEKGCESDRQSQYAEGGFDNARYESGKGLSERPASACTIKKGTLSRRVANGSKLGMQPLAARRLPPLRGGKLRRARQLGAAVL